METISEREAIKKKNNINNSINSSISNNTSYYEELNDETKMNILTLIEAGYKKKSSN